MNEPSRAYYQERYHTHTPTTPRNPPQLTPNFNEDEPSRASFQERYHTPHSPPETTPTNTQRINTYVTS